MTIGTEWAYGYAGSLLTAITSANQTVTYSYLANSTLQGNTVFKTNGTTKMTTSRQIDFLNRLKQISATPTGASAAASFNYGYNPANQRSAVTNVDSSFWSYGYDELGQLTNANRKLSGGTLIAGQQFQYDFDDLGNRLERGV